VAVIEVVDPAARLRTSWSRIAGEAASLATARPPIAADLVRGLVAESALDLPLPGSGRTVDRFAALIALGELDLTVGRLAEAHVDALAIRSELGDPGLHALDEVWAVWAAEPPSARVAARQVSAGRWQLDGRKAWCSGAGGSSHALVTAHAEDGPRLFAVDLREAGVQPVDDPWPAPALSGTDTRSVDFTAAAATPVGGPGDYVNRPGFWHGSVGVAAVWFGGAIGVARTLLRAGQRRGLGELELAHLGAVGASLAAGHAALINAAAAFDADPTDQARRAEILARSTRAVVEASATDVIDRVGRALGAAPLALDGDHARRVADLQLYLRQSHADRDLADLGRQLLEAGELM
jgi:alkylation response protein AidB-like acyl-CoA dehydrogenase